MNLEPQCMDHPGGNQSTVSYYCLDFHRNGNKHYYIWRHQPPEDTRPGHMALLIDLNGVYVPEHEIEKMVFHFVLPIGEILCLAFANCHTHNQREIKRKLKAGDLKLYSKTGFFTDLGAAKHWLETQCANG